MAMDAPSIGELDRRIAIRSKQDMPAMSGGIDAVYETVATVWGRIEPVGGAIFFGTQQLGDAVTDRMFIRRSSNLNERTITAEHVCEAGGLRYRVKRASALGGGREFVMLEVECLGHV